MHMRKYVVAYTSLFDHVTKMFQVEAYNDLEAAFKGMSKCNEGDEYFRTPAQLMQDYENPPDLATLKELVFNSDGLLGVLEIV